MNYEWCVAGDAHYEFTNILTGPNHGLDEESFLATYWGVQGREEPPADFLAKQDCYRLLYHSRQLLVAGRHWGVGEERWQFHDHALRELLGS